MHSINVPLLIKKIRNKLGITQEQFAQKVGVTFSTVNNWETGKRKPQPFLLEKLKEIAESEGISL